TARIDRLHLGRDAPATAGALRQDDRCHLCGRAPDASPEAHRHGHRGACSGLPPVIGRSCPTITPRSRYQCGNPALPFGSCLTKDLPLRSEGGGVLWLTACASLVPL